MVRPYGFADCPALAAADRFKAGFLGGAASLAALGCAVAAEPAGQDAGFLPARSNSEQILYLNVVEAGQFSVLVVGCDDDVSAQQWDIVRGEAGRCQKDFGGAAVDGDAGAVDEPDVDRPVAAGEDLGRSPRTKSATSASLTTLIR